MKSSSLSPLVRFFFFGPVFFNCFNNEKWVTLISYSNAVYDKITPPSSLEMCNLAKQVRIRFFSRAEGIHGKIYSWSLYSLQYRWYTGNEYNNNNFFGVQNTFELSQSVYNFIKSSQ